MYKILTIDDEPDIVNIVEKFLAKKGYEVTTAVGGQKGIEVLNSGIEVDLVIEQGKSVWGVEVKKSASIRSGDAKGLIRLAKQAGKQFKGGILLYTGNNCLSLEQENCFAVPMDALWT